MSLELIDLETALELYLTDKEAELAESSIQSHRYRLKHFLRWCEMENICNLNDLTGRKIRNTASGGATMGSSLSPARRPR